MPLLLLLATVVAADLSLQPVGSTTAPFRAEKHGFSWQSPELAVGDERPEVACYGVEHDQEPMGCERVTVALDESLPLIGLATLEDDAPLAPGKWTVILEVTPVGKASFLDEVEFTINAPKLPTQLVMVQEVLDFPCGGAFGPCGQVGLQQGLRIPVEPGGGNLGPVQISDVTGDGRYLAQPLNSEQWVARGAELVLRPAALVGLDVGNNIGTLELRSEHMVPVRLSYQVMLTLNRWWIPISLGLGAFVGWLLRWFAAARLELLRRADAVAPLQARCGRLRARRLGLERETHVEEIERRLQEMLDPEGAGFEAGLTAIRKELEEVEAAQREIERQLRAEQVRRERALERLADLPDALRPSVVEPPATGQDAEGVAGELRQVLALAAALREALDERLATPVAEATQLLELLRDPAGVPPAAAQPSVADLVDVLALGGQPVGEEQGWRGVALAVERLALMESLLARLRPEILRQSLLYRDAVRKAAGDSAGELAALNRPLVDVGQLADWWAGVRQDLDRVAVGRSPVVEITPFLASGDLVGAARKIAGPASTRGRTHASHRSFEVGGGEEPAVTEAALPAGGRVSPPRPRAEILFLEERPQPIDSAEVRAELAFTNGLVSVVVFGVNVLVVVVAMGEPFVGTAGQLLTLFAYGFTADLSVDGVVKLLAARAKKQPI